MATDRQTTMPRENRSAGASAGAQVPPDLADTRHDARGSAEQLKDEARDRLEEGKNAAADQAERAADTLNDVAARVGEENQTLAQYAQRVSEGVSRLADRLRTRNLDDLSADVQSLARRNPTMFLLGSVAVGFALSRFLKASSQRPRDPERAVGGDSARREQTGGTNASDGDAGPTKEC